MKKEILTLIIGILIGAIIATGIFLVLQNNSNNNMDRGGMMDSQEMRGRPDGDNVIDEFAPNSESETSSNNNSTDSSTANEL